jgi:calcineurin-like phosphoesterase family protein
MEPRIFITSDIHAYHKNIIKYCPESRKFSSVDEMNHAIIQNWNNKISAQDNVYILGDVSFSNAYDSSRFLDQLNGQKFLIRGNHDVKHIKSSDFKQRFAWIKDYYELRYNGRWMILSHYPFLTWNGSHHKSIMFHGHLHSINPMELDCRRYDVGLDGSPDFSPYLIDDVINIVDERLIKEIEICHHGREI